MTAKKKKSSEKAEKKLGSIKFVWYNPLLPTINNNNTDEKEYEEFGKAKEKTHTSLWRNSDLTFKFLVREDLSDPPILRVVPRLVA